MTTDIIDWRRVALFVVLTSLVVVGIVIVWTRLDRHPFEITLAPSQSFNGTIYVGDQVATPGYLPFKSEDTILSLIAAAGGAAPGADLSRLRLVVTSDQDNRSPQRVNLNRSDSWLLEALPGVGHTLAQRIIDFRSRSGPFRTVEDITLVSGVGRDTYERIKDLITVSD